jgi:23S rRNA U2552 (ribose-2'-O)-methylase RlmE/FtsJ
MKTVKELFLNKSGKVIFKWHHYLPIYESLFNPFVGTPVKVLEIGVLRGGSLKLWREYFGTDAQIFGIDIDPAAKQYEAEGIKIFIGDQGDKKFLADVLDEVGGFDIVIDDGAHTNHLVMTSLEELYSTTRHLYIVEDTHALYWWKGGHSLVRDIQYALMGNKTILSTLKVLSRILVRLITGNLSFMNFVKHKQDSLTTDWHGFRKKPNEDSPACRPAKGLKVSSFTSMTNGIRIYDSLVVFEKGEQLPRQVEFR